MTIAELTGSAGPTELSADVADRTTHERDSGAQTRWWRLPAAFSVALGAVLVLTHPIVPEVLLEIPDLAVGAVLLLAGSVFLLVRGPHSRTRSVAGVGFLAAAAAVSPAALWPSAIVPLFALDTSSRRRWASFAAVLGVAVLAGFLTPAVQDGARALLLEPDRKALEAVTVLPKAIFAAVIPWQAPLLGIRPNESPVPGLVAFCLIFLAAGWALAGVGRGRFRLAAAALALAAASLMTATLLGRVRLGNGLLLIAAVLFGLVFASEGVVRLLFQRLRAPRRPASLGLPALAAAGVVIASTLATGPVTIDRLAIWSDPDRAFGLLLAENPISALRWDYAALLRSCGDVDRWIAETDRCFRLLPEDAERRLDFSLDLLASGRPDLCLEHLKAALPDAGLRPIGATRTILSFLESKGEWDLYFGLAEKAAARHPELHAGIAAAAARAGREEIAERHLDAALAEDMPALRLFELAFRRLSRGQDVAGLGSLGSRVTALYPDSPLGPLALGRAAKLVRNDDEMLARYGEALTKDHDQPLVHYDIALVLHGRPGEQARAARHYQRVLELQPHHPRRRVIESWISELNSTTSTGGGN